MTVRVKVLDSDGNITEGDERLLPHWQSNPQQRLWLDIEGDISIEMHALLLALGCHEIAIGDIQQTRQPPKIHSFEQNTFILFRGIITLDENLVLVPQQIGFFVAEKTLVTIHNDESLSINRVWSESTDSNSLPDPGSVTLKIIDYASARYLQRILAFENHLGDLEEQLLSSPSDSIMSELVGYRSELRKLRRIFNYHDRLLQEILGEEPRFLGAGQDDSGHLWRALLDRCERLFSLTSMYYEICGDLVDGYISISSHELNTTMKILTIITAIFVPLSFLAGLYGMNFENMPELHMEYGYFFALAAMGSTAALLVYVFKRKKWL